MQTVFRPFSSRAAGASASRRTSVVARAEALVIPAGFKRVRRQLGPVLSPTIVLSVMCSVMPLMFGI
jgi:hypothetical protein